MRLWNLRRIGFGRSFPRKGRNVAIKTDKKKIALATQVLPPGVKPLGKPIDPAMRKLLNDDRGVASGGRGTAPRPAVPGARH